MIKKRENFIDENSEKSKKKNCILQQLTDEYNQKINDANLQGKSVIDKETTAAKEKKAELIKEAQKKVAQDTILYQEELKTTYSEAKESLQDEAKILADKISEKLFGKFSKEGEEG